MISRTTGQQLADQVGETVNTVICDGAGVISVDQHMGPSAITSWHWLGQRAPLHATAAGKAFLAFPGTVDPSELPNELPALTSHTIVDCEELLANVELVRERGYSVSDQEQEIGLVAVGAPIRELGGGPWWPYWSCPGPPSGSPRRRSRGSPRPR